MPRDYYEVLGVDRDAAPQEIKRAYRKLAMKYHPDKSKEAGDTDKFKEVSEAYAVLSDPEKRRVYDQVGHAGLEGQFGSSEQWFRDADFSTVFRDLGFDLGGVFSQMFGGGFGGAGQRRAARGEDLVTRITIDAEAVLEGTREEVTVERMDPCGSCEGSGAAPDGKRQRCATCNGQGQVGRSQRTPFGVFTQVTVCPSCEGEGVQISKPCQACRGKGLERARRTLVVRVPPGVEDGMRLRLQGQGHAHQRGPRGDAYAIVHVELPGHLERRGTNLVARLEVPAPAAVIGSRTTLDGVGETLEVEVPAGTQPGDVVRLKGKGLPPLGGGGRGDLFVEVKVTLPTKLSKAERDHWEALFDKSGAIERRGVFQKLGEKVRDTFG